MGKTSTLSTVINAKVKKAVNDFCKERGLKVQYVVEKALVELLEDEIDLAAYRERRNEPTIAFEEMLKELKLK